MNTLAHHDIGEETISSSGSSHLLPSMTSPLILEMKRLLHTYLKPSSLGYPSKLNASSLTQVVLLWLSLCAAVILQRSP